MYPGFTQSLEGIARIRKSLLSELPYGGVIASTGYHSGKSYFADILRQPTEIRFTASEDLRDELINWAQGPQNKEIMEEKMSDGTEYDFTNGPLECLVRDSDWEPWMRTRVVMMDTESEYPYRVAPHLGFEQGVPYEGNEHLYGTKKPAGSKKPEPVTLSDGSKVDLSEGPVEVLVRESRGDSDHMTWVHTILQGFDAKMEWYETPHRYYDECVLYKGNEHLFGTTDGIQK